MVIPFWSDAQGKGQRVPTAFTHMEVIRDLAEVRVRVVRRAPGSRSWGSVT